MKSTLAFCAAVFMLLASAVFTFADIARPKESPAPVAGRKLFTTPLAVVPDGNAWQARLQISPDSWRQLRAALDNAEANEAMVQSTARSSTRTIMAGFFMFLAVSFGGVWLARSGHSRNQKTIAAVVIAVAVMGATAVLTRANAAPPPGWRWQHLSQNLNEGTETKGTVDVEIMPEGNGIKLIVPLYKTNKSSDKKPGDE